MDINMIEVIEELEKEAPSITLIHNGVLKDRIFVNVKEKSSLDKLYRVMESRGIKIQLTKGKFYSATAIFDGYWCDISN
ncbi:hypothetical protein K413DRAFT_4697 [Clostridium sp. ASBs410]|nr:hypothetical protein K413DRAFT_4697 [Clostridium sp. ASBs410]